MQMLNGFPTQETRFGKMKRFWQASERGGFPRAGSFKLFSGEDTFDWIFLDHRAFWYRHVNDVAAVWRWRNAAAVAVRKNVPAHVESALHRIPTGSPTTRRVRPVLVTVNQ